MYKKLANKKCLKSINIQGSQIRKTVLSSQKNVQKKFFLVVYDVYKENNPLGKIFRTEKKSI